MPLPDDGKSVTIFRHSFWYNTRVWRTDGRTDGRICHNNIILCMHGHVDQENPPGLTWY